MMNYTPQKVFDYEAYLLLINEKIKRYGTDRTFTLLDFLTEEEEELLIKNGILDINDSDPTPLNIKNHFKFTQQIHSALLVKYPDDKYLIDLNLEQNIIHKISTDWYKKYGIEYDGR